MTLADVEEGHVATIVKVSGGREIKQRMLDMGITPGTRIKVERYAPLMDPIHIKVKGYSLALRVSESRMIEVKDAGEAEE